MKSFFIITGFALVLFTATCSPLTSTSSTVEDSFEVTGRIGEQGITSYQYGTHTLTNGDEETFYALKSETVDLDQYIGQEVKVTAVEIEGYPLEGGPSYLLVIKVKEN